MRKSGRSTLYRPAVKWLLRLIGLLLVAMPVAAWFLTDPAPRAAPASPPDARQAALAQYALRPLQNAVPSPGMPVRLVLDAPQVRAISTTIARERRFGRTALDMDAGGFHAILSRRLPLGRWLNLGFHVVSGAGDSSQRRVSIGRLELGPWLSTGALRVASRVLARKGTPRPDLDRLTRSLRLSEGHLQADVDIAALRLAASIAGLEGHIGGIGQIEAIHCRLQKAQREQPLADFPALVRRAFAEAPAPGNVAQSNRDTILALAMLVVDDRIGMLAGIPPSAIRSCGADARAVTLHGRVDSPKHWLVSAALAVTTGTELTEAAGEWKELADSVSRQEDFAGDASGFSFVDIGADRAGEWIARNAIAPDRAGGVRQALAQADAEKLMPGALLGFADGLSSAEFERRFGNVDDPRYRAERQRIDDVVRAGTLAGQRK